MKVTIFTPTYNRGSYIPVLYQTLQNQTDRNFEWLIIDDGSVDDTQTIVEAIMFKENDFEIRYLKKENEGLNQTINKGIDLAAGEAFCRVDSDDSIFDNAVEMIRANWHRIANDNNLCALVFLTVHFDNQQKIVGYHPFSEEKITNFWDYRTKYAGMGDRLEVVKTDVFKQFKFEQFGNEKFCLEGLMWNAMADQYDALYLNTPLYIRLYDDSGITSNLVKVLRNNPIGTTKFYADVCRRKPKFRYIVRSAGSYYRYGLFTKIGFLELARNISFGCTLIGLPVGLALFTLDKVIPSWYQIVRSRKLKL